MKTRYAISFNYTLTIENIVYLILNYHLARQYGGKMYIYVNDHHEGYHKDDVMEVVNYFVHSPNLCYRKSSADDYRDLAVKFIESGHAHLVSYKSSHDEDVALKNMELSQAAVLAREDKSLGIKLNTPEVRTFQLDDFVRGKIDVRVSEHDLTLFYGSNMAAQAFYNFADDSTLGITHVLREEKNSNYTSVEIYLHYLFGSSPPMYGHVNLPNMYTTSFQECMAKKVPSHMVSGLIAKSATYPDRKPTTSDFSWIRKDFSPVEGRHIRAVVAEWFMGLPLKDRVEMLSKSIPGAEKKEILHLLRLVNDAAEMTYADIAVFVDSCLTGPAYLMSDAPSAISDESLKCAPFFMRIRNISYMTAGEINAKITEFAVDSSIHSDRLEKLLSFSVLGRHFPVDIAKAMELIGREEVIKRLDKAEIMISNSSKFYAVR